MDEVRNKTTKKTFKIYGTQVDGYYGTMFLIYRDNEWIWEESNHFEPI